VPKDIAEWTGVFVTAAIVAGTDKDVIYAMPLGVLAGSLCGLFIVLADHRTIYAPLLRRIRRFRAPVAEML
jgi:hypothetical protein